MKTKYFIILIGLLFGSVVQAQHQITINASLEPEIKTITIQQQIVYKNHSNEPLNEIYLNDWANSFSSKTTPLGKRFSENYQSSFHFEKNKNRGRSNIISINNSQNKPLDWKRGDAVDIIHINLDKTLQSGETYTLNLNYNIVLPDDKFTRYGVTKNGDFKIRYWYISPAVFDGEWHYYGNKDLNNADLKVFMWIFSTRCTRTVLRWSGYVTVPLLLLPVLLLLVCMGMTSMMMMMAVVVLINLMITSTWK